MIVDELLDFSCRFNQRDPTQRCSAQRHCEILQVSLKYAPPPDSLTFLPALYKRLWTAADKLRSNFEAVVDKHADLAISNVELKSHE